MKDIIMSLIAGVIIGIIFKGLKLPLPAPPVLAGIMGIIGIFIGGLIFTQLMKLFSL
jgi:XapX domain-containing protein